MTSDDARQAIELLYEPLCATDMMPLAAAAGSGKRIE
jgi:hypothetical protein